MRSFPYLLGAKLEEAIALLEECAEGRDAVRGRNELPEVVRQLPAVPLHRLRRSVRADAAEREQSCMAAVNTTSLPLR